MSSMPVKESTSFTAEVEEEEPDNFVFMDRRTPTNKKSVMFFTWSQDTCFANVTNAHDRTTEARGLWGDPLLGNRSVKMTCSNCRHAIITKINFKPSWKSYVATICFSFVGCCCIPVRYKLFQHGQHTCPLCQIYLGHTGTECSWVHDRSCRIPHHRH